MKKEKTNELSEYEKIFSFEGLLRAWREFKKGKRYKKDVAIFEARLIENLLSLERDLLFDNYKHGKYLNFKISDPKPRDIHKASVRDRVVHHALYNFLYQKFDRSFVYDSFSCRKGKGIHRAMNRFRGFSYKVSKNNTKRCWVLKCDIKKCFASVDHKILKEILKTKIKCPRLVKIAEEIIDSFHANSVAVPKINLNKNLSPIYSFSAIAENEYMGASRSVGIPLGNLTSQIFINIYMNKFDQFVKRELKEKYYIRYADDFVILQNDKIKLENLLSKISIFLQDELKFFLHPDKVFVKTFTSGVDFLGWVHFPKFRVLRTKTKNRILKAFSSNLSDKSKTSYLGLLRHGNAQKIKKILVVLNRLKC